MRNVFLASELHTTSELEYRLAEEISSAASKTQPYSNHMFITVTIKYQFRKEFSIR
jgi:hypothetical protein